MAVQRTVVNFCATETLQTFIEGPRPLADLDNVGKATRGIVIQMVVPLIFKCNHEGHHRKVTASVSPSSSYSIRKSSVAKTLKNRYFLTDARPPLFIVVSKVTQVLGGI